MRYSIPPFQPPSPTLSSSSSSSKNAPFLLLCLLLLLSTIQQPIEALTGYMDCFEHDACRLNVCDQFSETLCPQPPSDGGEKNPPMICYQLKEDPWYECKPKHTHGSHKSSSSSSSDIKINNNVKGGESLWEEEVMNGNGNIENVAVASSTVGEGGGEESSTSGSSSSSSNEGSEVIVDDEEFEIDYGDDGSEEMTVEVVIKDEGISKVNCSQINNELSGESDSFTSNNQNVSCTELENYEIDIKLENSDESLEEDVQVDISVTKQNDVSVTMAGQDQNNQTVNATFDGDMDIVHMTYYTGDSNSSGIDQIQIQLDLKKDEGNSTDLEIEDIDVDIDLSETNNGNNETELDDINIEIDNFNSDNEREMNVTMTTILEEGEGEGDNTDSTTTEEEISVVEEYFNLTSGDIDEWEEMIHDEPTTATTSTNNATSDDYALNLTSGDIDEWEEMIHEPTTAATSTNATSSDSEDYSLNLTSGDIDEWEEMIHEPTVTSNATSSLASSSQDSYDALNLTSGDIDEWEDLIHSPLNETSNATSSNNATAENDVMDDDGEGNDGEYYDDGEDNDGEFNEDGWASEDGADGEFDNTDGEEEEDDGEADGEYDLVGLGDNDSDNGDGEEETDGEEKVGKGGETENTFMDLEKDALEMEAAEHGEYDEESGVVIGGTMGAHGQGMEMELPTTKEELVQDNGGVIAIPPGEEGLLPSDEDIIETESEEEEGGWL